MKIPTIDTNSVGGLKSIQDLYNMLAGESTTTSGGTTTTTEGISGEGMNEMLKSALANTNGLAAISSGQRTAGGYGSSVNTMLTNDLLTRTASQIAQQNKTTTKTTAPVTTTKGGITAEGATKSIGFIAGLQGLQELDKLTGASKKFKEWSNSNSASSTDSSEVSYGINVNGSGYSPAADSNAASNAYEASQSTGDSGSGMDFDASSYVDYGDSFDFGSAAMDEAATAANNTEFAPLPDEWMFEGFADGGEVSVNPKNRPNVLGTSQFNRVVDSRAGKIGGAAGENAPNAPNAPESGTSVGSNSPAPNQGSQSKSSGGGGGGGNHDWETGNPGGTLGKFVNTLATDDGQKFSKVIGTLGKLTQSPVLQQAGLIGGIATSKNPVQSAAITAGNIATKGALGTGLSLYKAAKNPGVATAIDAVSTLNPITASVNSILSIFGIPSLGTMTGAAVSGDLSNNIKLRSSERNHMSPEQQQAAKEWAANQGQEVGENINETVGNEMPGDGGDDVNTGGSGSGGSGSGGVRNPGPGVPGGYDGAGESDPGGMGTMGGGGYGTDSDGGGSDGYMHGGEISGPGTGTSDSIPARLSDGETVVTAQTTAKVKELFGEDFFHNLEKQFNAPAAVKQKMKGRA